MHQGNWKCSTCGGAITELPFEPRSEAGLTCRTCYAKKKDAENGSAPAPEAPEMASAAEQDMEPMPDDARSASEPAPGEDIGTPAVPGEKAKFEGDWKCSGCSNAITSLPFQPRNTDGLKCIDCFKKSKG